MPIKITNRQIKVHSEYFDFMPRWSLEKAEYEKAKIKSVDEKPESRYNRRDKQETIRRAGDMGKPLDHWPYFPTTDEIAYYEFLDKITDKQNRFHPGRDEDRRPLPKTGAMHAITDIIRLKTEEKGEFLLSKGQIMGHDAAGQEQTHPLSWPERWYKTLFRWDSDYNQNTKNFQKICLGPTGFETQYLLEFNKENAKSLFDQRANDTINFIVKIEQSDEAKMVEKDVNAVKTFERFANNTFDYLWSAEYIPLPLRQELRQEAVARGYIKGGSAEYQMTGQPQSKAGKTTYQ